MNFFEKIGAILDNLFGFGMQEDISSQVNSRKDNRLRDEDGKIYTTYQEEAEMDPYCDSEEVYYDDGEEYDYSEGDLPDEDIEYLREEYGEDEY